MAILLIPYRLSIVGNIQWLKNNKTGNAHIHFVGVKRGISISLFPKIQIYFGRFDQPFFSFSLSKKKGPIMIVNKKNKSIRRYIEKKH